MCESREGQREILLRLYEMAYLNLERRRTYEWKTSLAVWTAIAAYIALSLRTEPLPWNCGVLISIGVIAAGILVGHICFQWHIKLGHNVNRAQAHLYCHELEKLLAIQEGGTERRRLCQEIKKVQTWKHEYSSVFYHVLITLLLLALAALVTLRPQDNHEKGEAGTKKVVNQGHTSLPGGAQESSSQTQSRREGSEALP